MNDSGTAAAEMLRALADAAMVSGLALRIENLAIAAGILSSLSLGLFLIAIVSIRRWP